MVYITQVAEIALNSWRHCRVLNTQRVEKLMRNKSFCLPGREVRREAFCLRCRHLTEFNIPRADSKQDINKQSNPWRVHELMLRYQVT
ncbi:hypothetical protein TNCV_1770571 [Trichonephila clavipes]|nr:hypothetical protein TNCV_1770571 [Trichonephila clavipes]